MPEHAVARGLLDRASLPAGAQHEPGHRAGHNPHLVSTPTTDPVPATAPDGTDAADGTDGSTAEDAPAAAVDPTTPEEPAAAAAPSTAPSVERQLPADAVARGLVDRGSLPTQAPREPGHRAEHMPHTAAPATPVASPAPVAAATTDPSGAEPGTRPTVADAGQPDVTPQADAPSGRGLVDRGSLPAQAPREPGHRAEHNPHLAAPVSAPAAGEVPAPSAPAVTTRPSADATSDTAVPTDVSPTAPAAAPALAVPTAAPATAPLAPAASSTPTAPVVPAHVAEQVHTHVRAVHATGRGHETTLVLSPDHLGEVRVRVLVEDGVVSLQLGGAAAATQDALRDAMPELRRMVEESGLRLGTTDLADLSDRSAWSNGSDSRAAQERRPAAAPAAPGTDRPDVARVVDPVRPPRPGSGRGLDLIA